MDDYLRETHTKGGYTYELRDVKCGKPNCKKCPHGPYWYLKIKLRTGKTIQRYLGKNPPEELDAIKAAESDFLK